MMIDPQIAYLADAYTRDLVADVGRAAVSPLGREAVRDRLAKAMQQAVEQEYEALVQELTAERGAD